MRLCSLTLLLLCSLGVIAAENPKQDELVRVTVVRVADGDTLEVKPAKGKNFEVRLDDIDAPEYDQPGTELATRLLRDALGGKVVFLDIKATDKYGRKVAYVYDAQGRDVNRALVDAGAVWVDRRFRPAEGMIEAEEAARAAERGIWALPERDLIPPWEWRQRR